MVTATDLVSAVSDAVRREAPEWFEFSPAPLDAVCVNVPMLYPDGSAIQVYVLERDGEYVVTDHAATCGWLSLGRREPELTPYQQSLLEQACRGEGVEHDEWGLTARCASLAEVPYAIQSVALAAVRVADISYTFRSEGPPGS